VTRRNTFWGGVSCYLLPGHGWTRADADVLSIWHADGTAERGHPAAKKAGKRYFGSVRTLPSGRAQARYTGPDGRSYTGRTPEGKPLTFDSAQYADAYLARVHGDIQAGRWVSPDAPRPVEVVPESLAAYAAAWLAGRDLADRTREDYAQVLRDHVLPVFGTTAVPAIVPAAVRAWHAALKDKTGPTQRAHAYGLLRTIMNTAVADEVIPASPCRVRGGGS
jgi:hypothetical protein